MKANINKIILLIILIFSITCIVACDKEKTPTSDPVVEPTPEPTPQPTPEPTPVVQYIVTYDVDGKLTTSEVKEGEKAVKPIDPVKEGYKFLGWYSEDELYNFEAAVTADVTLVAKFEEILPVYDSNYILDNLSTENLVSYKSVELIQLGEIDLYEEKIDASIKSSDSKAVWNVIKETKELGGLDSSDDYIITKTETEEEGEFKGITISLKEEFFSTLDITSTVLNGKVLDEYANQVLGVNNIKNLEIKITLCEIANSDVSLGLRVAEVYITYLDTLSNFNVTVKLNYNY